MNTRRQQVTDWIDAQFDAQVELLERLVREPSVLMHETGVQDVVAGALAPLDVPIDRWEIDHDAIRDLPGYSPADWSYAGRENVVCRLPGRGGGRSLILNGHVDVVPSTPDAHWSGQPFEPRIVDGYMIGRGAADMKAGVSAMIHAALALRACDVPLLGDLIVESVIEEECTGNGTLATIARGYVADGVIIPEPFGEYMVHAHVGVMWCRIVVRGRGAHAEQASQSINAVRKAAVVMDAIESLQHQRNQEDRPAPFDSVDAPINYNVGAIQGGDWPSSSPEECVLNVRISCYPDEPLDEVQARFVADLQQQTAHDEWLADHPPEVEFYAFRAEGYRMDVDDPIFELVGRAHESVRGEFPGVYAYTGTTDARFHALYRGVPSMCYGPIGGKVHAPDEWVDLDSVKAVTKVLALATMDWCGVAD